MKEKMFSRLFRALPVTCWVLLAMAFIALPQHAVRADVGPKPSADFQFSFPQGSSLTITGGVLYECAEIDCAVPMPLEELGPQHFECHPTSCFALAYGFSDFLQLEITFSDGSTRRSDWFTKENFESEYTVEVMEDGLAVSERSELAHPLDPFQSLTYLGVLGVVLPFCLLGSIILVALGLLLWLGRQTRRQGSAAWKLSPFLIIAAWLFAVPASLLGSVWTFALPLTVFIEGIVAWGISRWQRIPTMAVVIAVTLLNLLTLVPLWFVTANLPDIWWLALLAGELVVWLVEATGLSLALGPRITVRKALLVSAAINLASLIIGLFLPLR